jgi:hypothetical protein
MKITWFDKATPHDMTDPERDRKLVKGWVKDHEEELHEIYHLANDSEMEAVKVITGDQEIDKRGRITLHTLELHFMKDLVLVLRAVEVQDSDSYTTRRTATQLGYLGMPSCGDDCGGSRPITKKEIK